MADEVLSVAQWRDRHGLEYRDVQALTRAGELQRVRRNAYGTARELDERAAHLRMIDAARASSHPDSVISHLSAAVVWGLPVKRTLAASVWLTREEGGNGRFRGGVRHMRSPLPAGDTVVVDGRAVTSVARTVIDVGRVSPYEWAVMAADAALAHGLCTRGELHEAAERAKGWAGVAGARRAVAFADERAQSPLESVSRVQISRLHLPKPVLQFEVVLNGVVVATSDFAWPEEGLIGEADGAAKYGRLLGPHDTPEAAVMREKRRDNLIAQAGWWLVHWGWEEAWQLDVLGRRLRDGFTAAVGSRRGR